MKKVKFLIAICLFLFSIWDISAQDEDVFYSDTLTKKFFQIKKDFSKKVFSVATKKEKRKPLNERLPQG